MNKKLNLAGSVEQLQKLVVKRGTKADKEAMEIVSEWLDYYREEVEQLRRSIPYDD